MKKGGGGKKLPGKLEKLVVGFRRLRQGARRLHQRRRHPVRLGLGLARRQERQARGAEDAQWREPADARRQPILGVDVWEHSYYIDYRNARPKYLEAWFDNLVNWEYVEEMLGKAK